MSNIVGVYGSLRNGCHNHVLLEQAKCVSTETIAGFTMHSLGSYPCVFESGNSDDSIVLELYEVTDYELSHLDQLEGHPFWYKRELFPTSVGDAWVYVMTDESSREEPRVSHGDWLKYFIEGER